MIFKKIFFIYFLSNFVVIPVLAAGDYGLSETAGAAGLKNFGNDLPSLIGSVLGTALSLVGVLFFALMLYGGVTWMLARGNSEDEKKALGTITAAIIGILIILGSYAITNFVFSSMFKSSSVANNSADTGSNTCSGKIETVAGCDTCAATMKAALGDTEGGKYACTDTAKCTGGTVIPNLCNASGQGDNVKCCTPIISGSNPPGGNTNPPEAVREWDSGFWACAWKLPECYGDGGEAYEELFSFCQQGDACNTTVCKKVTVEGNEVCVPQDGLPGTTNANSFCNSYCGTDEKEIDNQYCSILCSAIQK